MANSREPNNEIGFWQSLESLKDQHWTASSFEGEGQLVFKGQMRFGGTWKGSIASAQGNEEAQLYLLPSAVVEGSINVHSLTVGGQIKAGDVEAQSVILLEGSRVEAEIRAKKLEISEGAIFQGKSRVIGGPSKLEFH